MPNGKVIKHNIFDIDSITFTPYSTSLDTQIPDTSTISNGADLCWIDDDFRVLDNSNNLKPIYQAAHDWMIEKNIRCDFAVITTSSAATISTLKAWEEEGFNFLMHPTHDGWYNYKESYKHDITLVRKYFITNMRFFQQNIASAKRRILVYPGSSHAFQENIDFISQYVECAISATTKGSNPGTYNDRYKLKRITIQLSASHTKSQVKNLIKQYIDNGDWVILASHMYNFEVSDVLDETTNSFANLKEIVEYANSLCPLRSTESIWDKRRKLYDIH